MRINIYVLLFFLLECGSIQNSFSGKVFSRFAVLYSEGSQESSGDSEYLDPVVPLPPYSPSSYTENIETYLNEKSSRKATDDDLCFYRQLGVTENQLRDIEVIPSKQEFEKIKKDNPKCKSLVMKVMGPEGGDFEIASSDQVPPVVLKILAGELVKNILIVAVYKKNIDSYASPGFLLPGNYPVKGVISLPLKNTDTDGEKWRFCENKIDCLSGSSGVVNVDF